MALSWTIKIVLALIGCTLGVYVGQELLGGAALGWAVTGAIVVGFCYPLFQAAIAYRQGR